MDVDYKGEKIQPGQVHQMVHRETDSLRHEVQPGIKDDIYMIIEGLDQICHLIKYVPPSWRFSHCGPHNRGNDIKVLSSNVVTQPEGGNLQHTWLRRIIKPIYPVATCYESCHR